ncbi:MAG: hypothetical protein WAP52_00720 [Candidatus Sungiibacteriota bacterium]
MTTATLVKKLNREIGVLQKDIREIKKVVFAPLVDPEGEYRPSFVKKVLERTNERGPLYRFTTKEAFLKHVRSYK